MMFVQRIAKTLQDHKVRYAIVGGYAVALHGAVRGTVDVDLVIAFNRTQFIAFESALRLMGLESRLPVRAGQVFDYRKDYIENRNMVAWSFYNPIKPSEVVDVIITQDLAKIKTKRIKINGVELSVASITDLIRMKEKAGRAQDLEDVKALKRLMK
jgi:predicted nucleotidyltransferase